MHVLYCILLYYIYSTVLYVCAYVRMYIINVVYACTLWYCIVFYCILLYWIICTYVRMCVCTYVCMYMNVMYACVCMYCMVWHCMVSYRIVLFVLYGCMHVCMQKHGNPGDNLMILETFKIFPKMLMCLHEFPLVFIGFTWFSI